VILVAKTTPGGVDLGASETLSETIEVRGGVRRFVRTRLRKRIPVNREIFRVFRVSRGP